MVHHRLEDGIHEKHSLYTGDLVIRRASAARDWALHVPARVVGTGQSIDKIAYAGASRQKVGVVGVRSTDGEAESAASARRLAWNELDQEVALTDAPLVSRALPTSLVLAPSELVIITVIFGFDGCVRYI